MFVRVKASPTLPSDNMVIQLTMEKKHWFDGGIIGMRIKRLYNICNHNNLLLTL